MNLQIKSNFIGNSFKIYDSAMTINNNLYIFLEFFILSSSTISVESDSAIFIVKADSIDVNTNSTIITNYLAFFSSNSYTLDGRIYSIIYACTIEDTSQNPSKFFNFVLPTQQINISESYLSFYQNSSMTYSMEGFISFVEQLLQMNFTIIFVCESSMTFNPNFTLLGSSIGIFAENLDVFPNASISTIGMGCNNFEGPGKGTKIFNAQSECGGNGGSYGGFNGYGFGDDLDKSELCKQFATDFSVKYGDSFYPKYQGSGGGGYLGGYGGGVIFINILSDLLIDGMIQSDGESLDRDECLFVNGSGAGSGGSVQIYARQISGNGIISADGGDAFNYCGEGGGGRILVFFYNWETDTNIQSLLAWGGSISAKSGDRVIDLANLQNMSNMSFYGTEGSNKNNFSFYFKFC